MARKVSEVFGLSNEVLTDSYVDRGSLDEQVGGLVTAKQVHIALRGPSKSGKSWLRRTVLSDPIVVQCLHRKTCSDLYTDALSQLGVELSVESTQSKSFKGSVTASGEAGFKLLSKLGIATTTEHQKQSSNKFVPAGRDINDLRFVADIIRESGRRLVIEDFHYLSRIERQAFAFDLKAFWDWGVQVIIIGVWSVDNMLLALNPDLTGRIEEITVEWNAADLGRILDKGGNALNMRFDDPLKANLIDVAYGNAGQLQTLIIRALSDLKITEAAPTYARFTNADIAQNAAMEYAEQLNPRYQTFAENVASGIRKRTKSTNIYAHTMAVIMGAADSELIKGLSTDTIYQRASARQPRILLGNLKSVLSKIEALQVDSEGRGLVLAYDTKRGVSVVDRQLLLYRRFATVSWPWEDIIAASNNEDSVNADDSESELTGNLKFD
jgi:hypothetical protein